MSMVKRHKTLRANSIDEAMSANLRNIDWDARRVDRAANVARSLDYDGTPIDEELRGKFRTVESPLKGSYSNIASKQAK